MVSMAFLWLRADSAACSHGVSPCRALTCACFLGQEEDRLAWERHTFEERLRRAPEILVRLRSHTVWERTSVKLCFTVQGFPTPVVQW